MKNPKEKDGHQRESPTTRRNPKYLLLKNVEERGVKTSAQPLTGENIALIHAKLQVTEKVSEGFAKFDKAISEQTKLMRELTKELDTLNKNMAKILANDSAIELSVSKVGSLIDKASEEVELLVTGEKS